MKRIEYTHPGDACGRRLNDMKRIEYTHPRDAPNVVTAPGHEEDATETLRYVVDALPGEPLFVIRGRDVLASPVLAEYVRQCTHHGAYAQAQRAMEHRRRFHEWQAENAKLTHMPDPIPSAGNGAD